jgi:cyanophycinase
MHVLAKGNVYDMRERKFYVSKDALASRVPAPAAIDADSTVG